jgi:hypothetical protein
MLRTWVGVKSEEKSGWKLQILCSAETSHNSVTMMCRSNTAGAIGAGSISLTITAPRTFDDVLEAAGA